MIVLENINNGPERALTDEEKVTIVHQHSDGVKFYYYQQGDELPQFPVDLTELKARVRGAVDEQTRDAIYAGFIFDGVLFSMSDQAQINWTNFPAIPEVHPLTQEPIFPLSIYGKNDDPYTLSYSNKMAFYLTAMNHKNSALQTGNAHKGEVNACTTIEELETLAAGWGLQI